MNENTIEEYTPWNTEQSIKQSNEKKLRKTKTKQIKQNNDKKEDEDVKIKFLNKKDLLKRTLSFKIQNNENINRKMNKTRLNTQRKSVQMQPKIMDNKLINILNCFKKSQNQQCHNQFIKTISKINSQSQSQSKYRIKSMKSLNLHKNDNNQDKKQFNLDDLKKKIFSRKFSSIDSLVKIKNQLFKRQNQMKNTSILKKYTLKNLRINTQAQINQDNLKKNASKPINKISNEKLQTKKNHPKQIHIIDKLYSRFQ